MNLTEYHNQFPGSVRWRIARGQGLDIEGLGPVAPARDKMVRTSLYAAKYAAEYAAASQEFQVPVELLIVCSMTEPARRRTPKLVCARNPFTAS